MSQELTIEFRGCPYTWRCNLQQDDMGVELVDESGTSPEVVLEVNFHFHRIDLASFIAHRAELPLEMVEWFVEMARQALPSKYK